jgi:hypothetical protein
LAENGRPGKRKEPDHRRGVQETYRGRKMSILTGILTYLAGGITGVLLMCILQASREDDDK